MGTKKELEMKILIGLGFKVGFIPHFLLSRSPIKVFRYSFSDAYRYFSIALKVFFPCPIAIKFSAIIDYGVKFVKM